MQVSRREFVKLAIAGVALAGLGGMVSAQPVAAATAGDRFVPATAASAERAEAIARMMEIDLQQRLETTISTDPLVAETVSIAEKYGTGDPPRGAGRRRPGKAGRAS